jgi:D-beta-D-heptose 7-phosphate kinase / D-beta-D-heptose 1-phosphate adenosyltransferase
MTSDKAEAILSAMRGVKLAVVGDLMLDEYVWGDVSRVSPDAPVQVVDVRRRSAAIGGAGNVAQNVHIAGGEAVLVAVVGADAPGRAVSELLVSAGVDASGVIAITGRVTTVKTRVMARGQQVVRLDTEDRSALAPQDRERLLVALTSALTGCRAILVSDYAKGVVDGRLVAEIAARAAATGQEIPIIVDPKVADLGAYRGCTAITPNRKEAETAARMTTVSDDDLRETTRRIRQSSGARDVLVTLGERGMALGRSDGSFEIIPARAREVFDVTGAGDTVLAYFGLALAAGVPAGDAVRIANAAAGVAVGKLGAGPVAPHEVVRVVASGRGTSTKVVGLAQAVARVEHERSLGRSIVFTNGCFDLLHAGHVHLLERARSLGDFLVVGLNCDDSVRRLKGEDRPVVDEDGRVAVISALDAVDLVVVFQEDTPLELIRQLRPDVLVKGGDYQFETIVGAREVLALGGRIETIPLVGRMSTTRIVEMLKRDRTG